MALTEEQQAKRSRKESQIPSSLRRNPYVDYTEGWFFVTLCTRDAVPVLSVCEGNPAAPDGTPAAPHCRYTKLGQGVLSSWQRMQEVCPTAVVDLCEAMPEHFHGLVHLLPGNKRHLGSLISGFMSGCSHAYWDTLGISWRQNRDEKVRAMQEGGKGAYALLTPDRDNDHTHSLIGPALFVHGFNDTIPITPEQVEVKRAYIRDQARKRLLQGDHHECFRKVRHQHSPRWSEDRALQSILSDHSLQYDSQKLQDELTHVQLRLNRDGNRIGLDYVGPRNLLYAERKLPLVCHRADIRQFEQHRQAVLQAAREGVVIVSAFISQKERDIRDQLIAELLPFIEITDNGYSNKYKGIGKAFYAIAEQRLLQITPWSYLYEKDGTHVTRGMCDVMNELARTICNTPDDWWKN